MLCNVPNININIPSIMRYNIKKCNYIYRFYRRGVKLGVLKASSQ